MTDVMTKAEKSLGTLGRAIQKAGGKAVTGWSVAFGELTVEVRRDDIVAVLTRLRDQFEFQQLTDLAGVDYPERVERFDVVYHLLSLTKNLRLRARVTTDERAPVPSITGVYPAADWFEREAFDMYGMLFSGHPDLRRLLTDYGFQGYPLRKDFPMTGYVEVRYDEAQKRVVYEPVKLAQEFRNFDFLSPWEGAEYAASVLPGDEKAIGSAGKPSGGKA
ncbi:NADH-quinone oxidoreductase subunit C [Brevundimonas sp. BAL450]|uniref:NADH-quinone oxidoreductase subunit C n=1 Tax=Brevundimonas abyssalis TAR-001 TaxID=1391729 RepID=A0A8E0NCB8_9CAUL|nr:MULTISPECIES: NADH-quinone oxidoreductase subunit C [Brevundimonas]MBG7615770.1 NADH-quinone oxidoreductase subunit C [Brevundimonas sp. BAL450]GAD59731.1 NADH-ubiquinone oxidoreductase chain C [Brevundimonas abyssalis TAR-001]